jgi:hypothetical protein
MSDSFMLFIPRMFSKSVYNPRYALFLRARLSLYTSRVLYHKVLLLDNILVIDNISLDYY